LREDAIGSKDAVMEVCRRAESQAVRAGRGFCRPRQPLAQKRRRQIRRMETGKALSSAQITGKILKTNKFALKIDRALRNRIFERFPFR
jgi:hypothetical protein